MLADALSLENDIKSISIDLSCYTSGPMRLSLSEFKPVICHVAEGMR